MSPLLKEFRDFALRGNVVDMAVGIVVGVAFSAIVKSFVDDVLMPPIGLLVGNVDFSSLFLVLKSGATPGPYATIAAAHEAGAVTLNYGSFINTVIYFIIVAAAMFLLVRGMIKLQRKKEEAPAAEPATRDCPYCLSSIALKASRCPQCTSELKPQG